MRFRPSVLTLACMSVFALAACSAPSHVTTNPATPTHPTAGTQVTYDPLDDRYYDGRHFFMQSKSGKASLGREVVTNTCSPTTCEVVCPAPKYAMSGGCSIEGDGVLVDSNPSSDKNSGWSCRVRETDNLSRTTVTAYAVCAYLY